MTDNSQTPILVSTDGLASLLGESGVVVLDASFHLPDAQRDARAEFATAHIPGATFFDIDDVSDKSVDLPHMLPDERTMSEKCGALGIGDATQVVVYDSLGLFSAARVWWMLRAFGHERVSVLDGGLPKWLKEGRAMTAEVTAPIRQMFSAKLDTHAVRAMTAVRDNLDSKTEQLVDARGAGRFFGTVPEPRPGMRSGHIPGALNVPYTELVEAGSGVVKTAPSIEQVFVGAGVDLERPVVASCGSGVTACVLALGLALIGRQDAAIYDGSWSEWGSRADTPIECDAD